MSEPESPEPERELSSSGLGRLFSAARRDPGLDPGAIQRVVEKASEAPPPAPPWGSIAALALLGLTFLGFSAWNHRVASEAEVAPPAEVVAAPIAAPVVAPPVAPRDDEPAPVEALEATTPPPASTAVARSSERSARPREAEPEVAPAEAEVPSEGALLLRARAALRTDPARALSIAEEHRTAYPEGEMAAEREVLAIEALASLANFDAARARAARFATRYPASPYRGRVDAALARDSNATP